MNCEHFLHARRFLPGEQQSTSSHCSAPRARCSCWTPPMIESCPEDVRMNGAEDDSYSSQIRY